MHASMRCVYMGVDLPRKVTDLSFESMSLPMATRSDSTCVSVADDLASAPVNAAVAYLPESEVRVRAACAHEMQHNPERQRRGKRAGEGRGRETRKGELLRLVGSTRFSRRQPAHLEG